MHAAYSAENVSCFRLTWEIMDINKHKTTIILQHPLRIQQEVSKFVVPFPLFSPLFLSTSPVLLSGIPLKLLFL
jgi:hypothetical protein